MKLVENTAKIDLKENELGEKEIVVIAAHSYETNDNGLYLDGDVVEMKREVYPFLFNHGKSAADVIGDIRVSYDNDLKLYKGKVNMYDTNPAIVKAMENGAYDSVSISYYVNECDWDDEKGVVVTAATMNEVSLVSVGADPNAKMFKNGMNDEMANAIEEIKAENARKERIKEIKEANE